MTRPGDDNPLTIEKVETFLVQPPIRHTGKLGIGAFTHAESVIVRVTTHGGVQGVGESSLWAQFNENGYAVKETIDRYLAPAVTGLPVVDLERIVLAMEAAHHGSEAAKAGLEIACFDAAGRSLGCSVSTLLGGKVRDSVNVSYSIANQDIPKDLAEIDWLIEQGIKVLKIKTGVLGERDEIARVDAIRQHVGDDFDLRIDFNSGAKPESALRLCRELEQFRPTYIEQPIPGWDIAGMKAITTAIDTPISADESVMNFHNGMTVVTERAADIVSVKLMKLGGLLRSKKLAAVCEAGGIACYAGAMWESAIGLAASLHFSCSTPVVRYGSDYYTAQFLLQDDLVLEPLKVSDGDIYLPNGVGLGVEVDWDAVDKYRVV